ncbi:hypothetical protein PHYBLDRAFT_173094 [Phycomyces blakesleeanus NRRL 1555(-)]|uniref:Uncharacterized protein n=1 Tax=Phycomyces blakesleeanus (strain ATCC 8743b / DSM 1359 / FGSC 10004 / NBRC 33097 / NRRL 1555) TaxID=763407 RepID=A0A162TP39_PHYB8|nr:hypothetical protein PHYBLDRAFT_173094 [Phycomyces blakesleeanus NRRL 1555(-)]OAD68673.1 hypothetical protein PHYBLDRAFT_173094 [Phycomyces blakesleeanus NRRL 1555(-)]|eukprot:XP_018286713.1 hypothetical protein PHYBLDRAFT_173094 [Phycomyces blakesleeanus NRRL 1555(-)]
MYKAVSRFKQHQLAQTLIKAISLQKFTNSLNPTEIPTVHITVYISNHTIVDNRGKLRNLANNIYEQDLKASFRKDYDAKFETSIENFCGISGYKIRIDNEGLMDTRAKLVRPAYFSESKVGQAYEVLTG